MGEPFYELRWRTDSHSDISLHDHLHEAILIAHRVYRTYGPHVEVRIAATDGSLLMDDAFLRREWKAAGRYIGRARRRWPNLPDSTYVIAREYQKAPIGYEFTGSGLSIPLEWVDGVQMGVGLDDSGRVILAVMEK